MELFNYKALLCAEHGKEHVMCTNYSDVFVFPPAIGSAGCSTPDLYYNYSRSFTSSSKFSEGYDCTDLSETYRFNPTTSLVTSCASYMGQGFEQGIDGDIRGENLEFKDTFYCSRGDVYTWYQYDICCPCKSSPTPQWSQC